MRHVDQRLLEISTEQGSLAPILRHRERLFRKANRDHCCVYVFAAREYVKIGIAIDPKDRWGTIKTGNPLLEPPVYVSPRMDHARRIERLAHAALEAHRCSGEWFKCNRYYAAEIVKQLCEENKKQA